MNKTSIEWCDYSSNPIRAKHNGKVGWACVRVSDGCKHCYAATINKRFGTGLDFSFGDTEKVEFWLDERKLAKWQRKPKDATKNKVFVCDMTDLFQPSVHSTMLRAVFQAMAAAPWWTFQVLTKRPERMRPVFMTRVGKARAGRLLDSREWNEFPTVTAEVTS